MSFGWLMPASMTQKASSPSVESMETGIPICEFRFMRLRAVLPDMERMWASSSLVVVFPAVPVMPATRPGKASRQAWAMRPSAAVLFSTRSTGATGLPPKGSRSASTAEAPAPTAASAKSCPSARSPRRATKMSPGFACRLSVQAPVSVTEEGWRTVACACLAACSSVICTRSAP